MDETPNDSTSVLQAIFQTEGFCFLPQRCVALVDYRVLAKCTGEKCKLTKA